MFKSILFKIIALLCVGVLLACLLSGIGLIVDRFKTRTMSNSNRTQQLALQLAEQMLLEEQFISSHDDVLLPQIQASEAQISQTLAHLQQAIRNPAMRQIVDTIIKINAVRRRGFALMTDNMATIAAAMTDHHDLTNRMIIGILSIIGLIDQAESRALEDGQALTPNETILRNQLNNLTDVVEQRVLAVQSFYIQVDFAAFQAARASIRDLSNLENMLNFLGNPKYLALWGQFTPLWAQCAQVETTLEQELIANVALKTQLQQRGHQMQAMLHQMVAVSDESIEQATMISQRTIVMGFVVGTVLISFFGLAIIRSTRKSLTGVIAGFNALVSGEGDLTYRLPIISHDELGQLCRLFNQFMEQLQTLVQVIRMSGLKIMTSSTELAAMARQQDATLDHQVDATQQVVDDIQTISQAAMTLSDEMALVATMTHTSAEFAAAGQQDLVRLGETFQRMESASTAISQKLEMIHHKAENITSIVTTINKVADQTNLLSLNAAIEAEKAGEFGRGFTVVAREIRRLADQTASATLDIGQMVHAMQQAVSGGVMEMDKFLSVVRSGTQDVGKISGELFAFIEHVQSLSPKFSEMNAVMLQQSSHAQTGQTEIHHLRDSMAEIKATLHETYIAIEQLNETARSLQDQVERFKLA